VAGGWQWRLKIVDADQLSNLGYEKFKVQSSRFKVEVALMDLERLGLPLALGYLQPGERFWPLGAPGEKKLQDFLVDAKVPRWLRPHIPVVRSQGRAVWLPGLRLADPVKITPHTRRVLIIHASPITPAAQQVWQVLSNRRR
jgi:tRNA(Ile)-lysidine synthetase-like protein